MTAAAENSHDSQAQGRPLSAVLAQEDTGLTGSRMTWVTFFAGPNDLADLMRFVYTETDCRVYEAYSMPDQQRREFSTLDSVAPIFLTAAPQLVLWSPSVGAPPMVRRVDFTRGAVPGHTHRYVTEGCSLVTLVCGAAGQDVLNASRLGWWTEASARRKADPSLSPERVNWAELAALGRRFRSHIVREMRRARAGDLPVLAQALSLTLEGARLRDPSQPTAKLDLKQSPAS